MYKRKHIDELTMVNIDLSFTRGESDQNADGKKLLAGNVESREFRYNSTIMSEKIRKS